MLRALRICTLLAATLAISGCATMHEIKAEVATFGPWPSQRAPGTYAFERLPSQQEQPKLQEQLESAARPALDAAGFKPAGSAAEAQYLLQLGARVSISDPSFFYAPPFAWGGRLRWGWRGHHGWGRAGWGMGFTTYGSSYFEREVAVLIRDAKTGELLYEARARNDGTNSSISHFLPALYRAALKDFPAVSSSPREVTVEVAPH